MSPTCLQLLCSLLVVIANVADTSAACQHRTDFRQCAKYCLQTYAGMIWIGCCDRVERYGACPSSTEPTYNHHLNLAALHCCSDLDCPDGFKCCREAGYQPYNLCKLAIHVPEIPTDTDSQVDSSGNDSLEYYDYDGSGGPDGNDSGSGSGGGSEEVIDDTESGRGNESETGSEAGNGTDSTESETGSGDGSLTGGNMSGSRGFGIDIDDDDYGGGSGSASGGGSEEVIDDTESGRGNESETGSEAGNGTDSTEGETGSGDGSLTGGNASGGGRGIGTDINDDENGGGSGSGDNESDGSGSLPKNENENTDITDTLEGDLYFEDEDGNRKEYKPNDKSEDNDGNIRKEGPSKSKETVESEDYPNHEW